MCGKMTEQMKEWAGKFGEEYTDRNVMSPDEFEKLIRRRIGFSRTEQIDDFLCDLKLNNTLEVGCNVGNQLLLLQKEGFKNLYGIELNRYAVEKSKERTKGKEIDIIQGTAFDIPFKDAYFDLVFTSGVLIHISPQDINDVLDEIYSAQGNTYGAQNISLRIISRLIIGGITNCSGRQILQSYIYRFPDLKLIKERKYPYLEDRKLVDQVFLLKKI